MAARECVIVVERLANKRYRAHCPRFPDCEAIRCTKRAARQAVAEAIERILGERAETRKTPMHADGQ